MNNTGKLKFKKENDKPKLRDSLIFILIFVLCVVTVITIQIKSQQKKEAETLNSGRVESTVTTDKAESAPAAAVKVEQPMAEADKKAEADKLQTAALSIDKTDSEATAATDNTKQEKVPPEEKEVPEAAQKKLSFMQPLSGKILKKYSDTELLYSETMEDWRLHLGLDIAAPVGTEVLSCEAGTVEEITEDEEYGTTVSIRHSERLVTGYSNLAGSLSVTVGESVLKGQKIGVVGDTAMYEILDDAHLHFYMSDNGVYINPVKYIKFE